MHAHRARARSARSGARRSTDVGGVSDDTLAEDTDLTMAICRAGWRVVYAPDARAWTEAPATLGQLWRQRYRWCYGTMQAMWKHRAPCSSAAPPASSAGAACPTCSPSRCCCRCSRPSSTSPPLYSIVFLASPQIAYVWLGFLALQLRRRGLRVPPGRRTARAAVEPALQQFVYRQLMYLVVIQSVASALYGVRLRWQKLQRTGEMDAVPPHGDGPSAQSATAVLPKS